MNMGTWVYLRFSVGEKKLYIGLFALINCTSTSCLAYLVGRRSGGTR